MEIPEKNEKDEVDFGAIENTTVGKVLKALDAGDRSAFANWVLPQAVLIHNGEPENLWTWADTFFFGDSTTRVASIQKTEGKGTTVYATLDSALAGVIGVKLVFELSGNKVALLNAGRP